MNKLPKKIISISLKDQFIFYNAVDESDESFRKLTKNWDKNDTKWKNIRQIYIEEKNINKLNELKFEFEILKQENSELLTQIENQRKLLELSHLIYNDMNFFTDYTKNWSDNSMKKIKKWKNLFKKISDSDDW